MLHLIDVWKWFISDDSPLWIGTLCYIVSLITGRKDPRYSNRLFVYTGIDFTMYSIKTNNWGLLLFSTIFLIHRALKAWREY